MGGPSNLFEVEIFLKNMFRDPHILQIKSHFLRGMIGNFIVNARLKEAQKNYQAIGGKSPITPLTFSLIQKLSRLEPNLFFTYAMRYTPPYASMVVQELKQKEVEEVILISLYPQYSTTTTLSSIEDFKQACKTQDYAPQMRVIDRFFDHPLFLECVRARILEALGERDSNEFVLIFSAHGLPKSIVEAGDPYQKECELNVKLLIEFLQKQNLHFKEVCLAYQSKVGPMKWIMPATSEVIKKKKNQKVIVYPLAFSMDNSETYFELDIELRKMAQTCGIQEFLLCECPNDSDEFANLILKLTQGGKSSES